jgi:hypothetical protein
VHGKVLHCTFLQTLLLAMLCRIFGDE